MWLLSVDVVHCKGRKLENHEETYFMFIHDIWSSTKGFNSFKKKIYLLHKEIAVLIKLILLIINTVKRVLYLFCLDFLLLLLKSKTV